MEFIYLVIGLAAGAAIGWLVAKLRSPKVSDDAGVSTDTLNESIRQLEIRLLERDRQIETLEKKLGLDENVKAAENQVLQVLNPVKDNLAKMEQRILEMEKERTTQFSTAKQAFETVKGDTELLRQATEQLNRALTNTNTRGHWGEIQLERFAEAAGLERFIDYDLQKKLAGPDDDKRPDMVINLPDNKHIIIDAKVPLTEYRRACDLRDGGQTGADLFKAHATVVKGHIDALAKREYWSRVDSSADYVLLFMPSDAVLQEALLANPDLFDYALKQNVALVSPVSLFTTLKAVAYTWKAYEQTQEVKQVLKIGKEIHERIGVVVGHLNKLGNSITSTVKNFNAFVSSFETRVLVSARRFPGLDASKLDTINEIAEGPSQIVAGELEDVDLGELTAESTMDSDGEDDSR